MPIVQALDVVLRHLPSLRMEPIGRSFFSHPRHPPFLLGQGRELWPGYFQSLRPTSGWKLMLNIDVASTAFYTEQSVIDFMCTVLKDNRRHNASHDVTQQDREQFTSRPLRDADRVRFSKEIKGLKIQVAHLPYPRKYKVNGLTKLTAQKQTFPLDDDTLCTVEEYFREKYKLSLQYPHLPCLHVGSPSRNITYPWSYVSLLVDKGALRSYQTCKQHK